MTRRHRLMTCSTWNSATTRRPRMGGAAQFNGNISETIWKTATMDKQSYGYGYDPLNRITTGLYYNANNAAHSGRYNEKIGDVGRSAYDLNGNIRNILRSGRKDSTSYGLMDDLGYTYVNGNRLHAVRDSIEINPHEKGFRELLK